jgi:hypothetical protein
MAALRSAISLRMAELLERVGLKVLDLEIATPRAGVQTSARRVDGVRSVKAAELVVVILVFIFRGAAVGSLPPAQSA